MKKSATKSDIDHLIKVLKRKKDLTWALFYKTCSEYGVRDVPTLTYVQMRVNGRNDFVSQLYAN